MSETAINVQNLSKRYTLGASRKRYKTLRESIIESFHSTFRRNGRAQHEERSFWALRDVSLEINRGEVVGIIGRNGAGKSTLLKVLSRITDPTAGEVEINGRVGSLLEVGTGFHPELTGRENIYLNGAILGMKRNEITAKFDEIVAFAETEKFLDTPVKFYSSGMYTRLAFAVAAHLESEILLVDEVLAVGDAQFQKKCLGKMREVTEGGGRTVLFVSHNMGAILSLCPRSVLLDRGKLAGFGPSAQITSQYLDLNRGITGAVGVFERLGTETGQHLLTRATVLDQHGNPSFEYQYGEPLTLLLETNPKITNKFGVEVRVKNSRQEVIAYLSSWINPTASDGRFTPGQSIEIKIPALKLVQDSYYLDFICRIPLVYHVDNWWDTVTFNVIGCRPGESPISLQAADELGSVVFSDATMVVAASSARPLAAAEVVRP